MTSETAKRKISSCVSSVYKAKVDFCADFEYDIGKKYGGTSGEYKSLGTGAGDSDPRSLRSIRQWWGGGRMNSFSVEQKRVDVFESAAPNKPVIYLNTYGREGAQIFQYLTDIGCQDFSLVAVSKLEWNHDMVPWGIPPIFKNGASYTSGADGYLRLLINQIIPKAESLLQGTPAWRGIAGYSLAGLFALYSIYQTDAFSRVASVSGSLWFPGIKEYVVSRTPVKKPADIFFSLGDRECRTQNSLLRCVQQNTESIERYYHEQGIDTTFQLNPGNHFKDVVQRTAAGLQWLLSREYDP